MNAEDIKLVEFLDVMTRHHFLEDKGMEMIHPTLEQTFVRFMKEVVEKIEKEYQTEFTEIGTFSKLYDNISSNFFLKTIENNLNRYTIDLEGISKSIIRFNPTQMINLYNAFYIAIREISKSRKDGRNEKSVEVCKKLVFELDLVRPKEESQTIIISKEEFLKAKEGFERIHNSLSKTILPFI
ncbi:MAG: hypothetical protein AMQ74_01663 [Candidatus Methanofastidiosum methylothiophilum]|uniref:Uncharacterized protein n=1 Tax=Candidatus Methanofastidiosum methylothiophilum TaxID=1705564 RepID=A0A150IRM0_9EURY|nr:MAG: hypothetical protein AMQ74_01663 [Candidatus Methanofastidiosum methylthiophilus]